LLGELGHQLLSHSKYNNLRIEMKKTSSLLAWFTILIALSLVNAGCRGKANSLADPAGGRNPEDLPEIAFDVFKPMDGGIDLAPDEIKGRNTWNLWCGGNEQFWDRMSREAYGLTDMLRMIDSRNRGARFKELGLINQPGYRQASKPDQYGVWIDEAVEPEPAAIDPKVYGRATGIMGFRLFENPDFQGEAVKKWDANRYYADLDYAADPKLVRPYRVGVSCGSCHIAFNPISPPSTLRTRNGRTSLLRLATSTYAKAESLPTRSEKAASFGRCSRPSRLALPTPRASRPITSTTPTRSTPFFFSAIGWTLLKRKNSPATR